MGRTFELPTFLGRTVPVEFIARLERFEVEGASLVLRCASDRHAPELHDYYGTVCETTFRAPEAGAAYTVRIDALTDEILRLRYARGDAVAENASPMVVGSFDGPSRFEVGETEGGLVARTGALALEVARDPWQLRLRDGKGRVVFATKPVDIAPLMRPEEQWNPPEQRWIFLHRYAYPAGLTAGADAPQAFASFDLRHDEHIVGFGEGFGPLDKRGSQQRLWLQEAFSNASPASYKQVPFWLSTRGYGMFVHSSNALSVNVGSLEHTALSVVAEESESFDAYLIYGPEPAQILPRYTAITGAPAVPPKWSFGLWMGRISYDRQEQVEGVARELRERRIPCDVIHIDTNWFARDWACDLEFGPEKFPDPTAMTARLAEQGFRVSLWQWPNMLVGTPMFDEGLPEGYFAGRSNGKTHTYPGFMDDGALIDYSNPAAVAWVQEKFRALFRQGVAAIKTDFGEGAPPDAVYSGAPGAAMHNLYPLLYNRAVFEVTREMRGEGEGVVWSRSAWAGSQRYPVHWSGDGVARFEDLPCVLRSMLSFGLSGFPFYSHDIGGFSGIPSPELYVRWAQLGLFSSHPRAHGTPPREPWAYGDEAERLFREAAELRYRLMPYIYSEAVAGARASLPLVRALLLAWPDDPVAATIDDQYLFGRSLLVAPVLDDSERRRVYLPRGRWRDYRSREPLEGGRFHEVHASLDTLPLFVPAGAALVYGPPQQHVDEVPLDPLTLELWDPTEGEGEYLLHDQHRPDATLRWRRDGARLELEIDGAPGRVEVRTVGARVREVDGDDGGEVADGAATLPGDGRYRLTLENV